MNLSNIHEWQNWLQQFNDLFTSNSWKAILDELSVPAVRLLFTSSRQRTQSSSSFAQPSREQSRGNSGPGRGRDTTQDKKHERDRSNTQRDRKDQPAQRGDRSSRHKTSDSGPSDKRSVTRSASRHSARSDNRSDTQSGSRKETPRDKTWCVGCEVTTHSSDECRSHFRLKSKWTAALRQ